MPFVFRELGRYRGPEPVVLVSTIARKNVLLAESLSSPVWWDEVKRAENPEGDADGSSRLACHATSGVWRQSD